MPSPDAQTDFSKISLSTLFSQGSKPLDNFLDLMEYFHDRQDLDIFQVVKTKKDVLQKMQMAQYEPLNKLLSLLQPSEKQQSIYQLLINSPVQNLPNKNLILHQENLNKLTLLVRKTLQNQKSVAYQILLCVEYLRELSSTLPQINALLLHDFSDKENDQTKISLLVRKLLTDTNEGQDKSRYLSRDQFQNLEAVCLYLKELYFGQYKDTYHPLLDLFILSESPSPGEDEISKTIQDNQKTIQYFNEDISLFLALCKGDDLAYELTDSAAYRRALPYIPKEPEELVRSKATTSAVDPSTSETDSDPSTSYRHLSNSSSNSSHSLSLESTQSASSNSSHSRSLKSALSSQADYSLHSNSYDTARGSSAYSSRSGSYKTVIGSTPESEEDPVNPSTTSTDHQPYPHKQEKKPFSFIAWLKSILRKLSLIWPFKLFSSSPKKPPSLHIQPLDRTSEVYSDSKKSKSNILLKKPYPKPTSSSRLCSDPGKRSH